MAESKMIRLNQAVRKLNVGIDTIVEFLAEKGHDIERSPNTKISSNQYAILAKEYATSAFEKEEASGLKFGSKPTENIVISSTPTPEKVEPEKIVPTTVEKQKVAVEVTPTVKKESKPAEEVSKKVSKKETSTVVSPKLQGIKVVGKINLGGKKKKSSTPDKPKEKKPKSKKTAEMPIVAKKKKTKAIKKSDFKPKTETKLPTEKPAEVKTKKKVVSTKKVSTEKKVPKTTADKNTPTTEVSTIQAKADSLPGLKVLGKIDLPKKPTKTDKPKSNTHTKRKKPRKRISIGKKTIGGNTPQRTGRKLSKFDKKKKVVKKELTDKEIQAKIKTTLAKLSRSKPGVGVGRARYRKDKRSAVADAQDLKEQIEFAESKTLKITEFISANDLASLMNVNVSEVISTCMSLGMFVSINQRLDAESITIIADEFGFNIEFTSQDEKVDVVEIEDAEDTLVNRAPIVTVMGHVDHGKTSLLDYIRGAKVIDGEAGGITQHIGAYDVTTESGKKIVFLDTPGHEAFTAMRARGAKITDIVIIVVAADDGVMQRTEEAINHAQVAGVPIIIAINKIDRETANPEKIKEALSAINILVEDWGGKYQCQEVSAKTGQGIEDLLEKILLEAELLELKANPNKKAVGSVIEATLDKGRGYLTTMMVQAGTLNIGDVVLAGSYFGKVKAMFDYKGAKLKKVGPSTPLQLLGLDGAPQAGDKFHVMDSDRDAREIANKRVQILREQSVRTKKHITLDEIGRRLAIGSFKELNVIVKGDVDGSVEALSGSLLKLSTDEIQVNIIHKGIGQISESDALLASASDAIIIGFQVRPSGGAKKIAEKNEIEIRLYSVIYDAIDEIKDAMEGLLAPTVESVITGNIEVRELFKIPKVGIVAGCYVTDGFVKRSNHIRLIRDGIVIYTGAIGQLKRFKEDQAEVKKGYECGISIKSLNDIKVGDVIEGFEEQEIKRSL